MAGGAQDQLFEVGVVAGGAGAFDAIELGQVEARVDGELRALLSNINDKKPTEAQLSRAMDLDARVQQAREAHITALTSKNRVRAICEGLDAKKSMLMSLGAFQRAEFGDMAMREKALNSANNG